MALEFEKLTHDIQEMVRRTHRREQERDLLLDELLERLRAHATDWDGFEFCLGLAIKRAGLKKLRAARPLHNEEPMDAALDPPLLPLQATIVASDGSQIVPDRHAPFLYSLINVGIFVYFHGRGETPAQYALADLDYPGKEAPESGSLSPAKFADSGTIVGLRRDKAEIEALARSTWKYRREDRPFLALLDQRLLYWPAVGAGDSEGSKEIVLQAWQEAMTGIRQSEGLLAGYIVRSRKQSVITLLKSLDIEEPDFDLTGLTEQDSSFGLTDTMLFNQILGPGQRSKVFVDVSQHNDDFRRQDAHNEVCFFYLNPGGTGRQVARVDIPMWVARDPDVVGAVHALIYDQCQILGNYPYALARADEIAVVGRRDQQSLDVMIENAMQRYGITAMPTAKRSSKEVARAGRTRHEM